MAHTHKSQGSETAAEAAAALLTRCCAGGEHEQAGCRPPGLAGTNNNGGIAPSFAQPFAGGVGRPRSLPNSLCTTVLAQAPHHAAALRPAPLYCAHILPLPTCITRKCDVVRFLPGGGGMRVRWVPHDMVWCGVGWDRVGRGLGRMRWGGGCSGLTWVGRWCRGHQGDVAVVGFAPLRGWCMVVVMVAVDGCEGNEAAPPRPGPPHRTSRVPVERKHERHGVLGHRGGRVGGHAHDTDAVHGARRQVHAVKAGAAQRNKLDARRGQHRHDLREGPPARVVGGRGAGRAGHVWRGVPGHVPCVAGRGVCRRPTLGVCWEVCCHA